MQSMPYYQQGYQAPAYPTTGTPATSSVMNNGNPPIMTHANGLPPLQHPALAEGAVHPRPKRKQVKNACTNCQKACKKCDDARPCPRCLKYGIADTCVNSVRKERKKGIKRGPYKRRQKPEDKANGHKEMGADQQQQPAQGQYAPAALRASSMPFGYPSNLNQYGQPYDPYGQYAAYHKDQMMAQPYVVSSVYPPMGYPVLVSGNNNGGENANNQAQHQQPYQPPITQQHYNGMMHHSPQQPRPFTGDHFNSENGSPQTQVHYQQQQQQQQQQQPQQQQQQPQQLSHAQTQSQQQERSSPDVKKEQQPETLIKSQPMTPVPSTSTSSATQSPPGSTEDEEGSKFALLSQLCSAALHHDHNRTETNNSQQQS